jgi:hypothetical protein
MIEIPIGACPVCGGAGMMHPYEANHVLCAGACASELRADDWNRLSRAAALLRAVEALEAAVQERYDPDASGSVLLDDRFIRDTLKWGEVAYGPLADALRALAGKVMR